MAILDLEDAYLSVPVLNQYTKHLIFKFKDKYYKYLVMPFGASIGTAQIYKAPQTYCLLSSHLGNMAGYIH